jgi:hypothetical protein
MLPPQFLLVHAARFDSGCNKVRQPMRVSQSLDVRRCIDNFEYLGDIATEYVLQSVVVLASLLHAGERFTKSPFCVVTNGQRAARPQDAMNQIDICQNVRTKDTTS